MTFAPSRPCRHPLCSALVPAGAGTYCPAHRTQKTEARRQSDRFRGHAAARGYDARWQAYRLTFLARWPLCMGVLIPGPDWTREAAEAFHAERQRRHELGELLWLPAHRSQLTAYRFEPWDVGRRAVVVDHIIPHKGDEELMWAEWNHQPLTKRAHDRKTAAEKWFEGPSLAAVRGQPPAVSTFSP